MNIVVHISAFGHAGCSFSYMKIVTGDLRKKDEFTAHQVTLAEMFRNSPHINNENPGVMHKVDADT